MVQYEDLATWTQGILSRGNIDAFSEFLLRDTGPRSMDESHVLKSFIYIFGRMYN